MAEEGVSHMSEWDFPVSIEEMTEVLRKAGFQAAFYHYPTANHPFSHFYGMVEGSKAKSVL